MEELRSEPGSAQIWKLGSGLFLEDFQLSCPSPNDLQGEAESKGRATGAKTHPTRRGRCCHRRRVRRVGAGAVGRRDRAWPRESALTPCYKEDPEALEQEGASQGAN